MRKENDVCAYILNFCNKVVWKFSWAERRSYVAKGPIMYNNIVRPLTPSSPFREINKEIKAFSILSIITNFYFIVYLISRVF